MALGKALQSKKIPGLSFQKKNFFNQITGKPQEGLYVHITNYNAWHPTELSFHLMQLACEWNEQNPFDTATDLKKSLFNKHVGSTEWWNAISSLGSDINLTYFLDQWHKQAQTFQTWSKKYWLY